jgi:hypothetical protein
MGNLSRYIWCEDMSEHFNDDEITFNEVDNFVNEVIDKLIAKYGHKMMIKHYVYFSANIQFKIHALMLKDTLPKLWIERDKDKRDGSDIYV